MTNLLNFDKPNKVVIDHGFDGGPTGGYMPQMDQVDANRWKAKKFNIGKDNARIELRKSFHGARGVTQVFIVVANDGWDMADKYEYRKKSTGGSVCTTGKHFRMSMNGPLVLTADEFAEIPAIVAEAQTYIETQKE